ncbi:kinesin-like protein KIF18B [Gymnogyps californianus]|uniref:kinesin-like protein KIF18B n=1 Tax=Gymnogyps californianus TaxID=33616 RepID=UPI0021C7176B|nr:kinesin-like protein KIF18B [Gymnogyps californianus]XP_050767748.1 kinesin-like protein KIF18B [Gymnogyps californianus]
MALGPPPEEGTVAVMVRVRPPTPCERERTVHPVLHVVDQHVLVFDPEEPSGPPGSVLPTRGPKHPGKDLKFVFDRVFGEGATQEEVFQHTTREVLDSVLNGYNCSVFAYGATGAGKTYTMLGSEKSPGIMYLTMVELYKRIEARREEKSCEVLVSYQEVYNEQIHDLLEPKGPLAIREDPEKGVVVQGLSFHQPASAEQLLEMLANGNKNRTQHPTDANATSSRSHAIFQICVKQQDRVDGLTRDLQVAKMSLIDLAGSERASVTNTKGERLREGANINRSLLALINVINALADAKSKKTHIPYRDSKLTRLLKDSIGGNCRTIMIAAVSPSVLAYEDTYNTLKYANRAKEIKLSLKSNVLSFDCHVSKYAVICEQLKAEVADLRAKLRAYECAAREAKNQVPGPLAPLSSSPVGLLRLEEAVPKTCLALDDQRESNGEQQELEAGWPVQLQLESEEEAPEEMPPSSPRAAHQTRVQLEPKKPSHLRGLSSSQTQTLIATILSVARKQYSLLKDAKLLTPDMVSEFAELERLVHREAGVSLEQATSPNRPTEVSGAAPAQGMQQGCDAEASVAVPSAPVTSAALQCLQQLAPLSSPTPMAPNPIKKRRRSEMNSASQSGTPRSLKMRMKRQRRCGKEAETPRAAQSPGTPCLKAAAQAPPVSPVPSCCTPKICPLTVTKNRVPLVMSAAQNCCTLPALPVHDLNVTFEICKDSGSPGAAKPAAFSLPELSVWENVQGLLNKPGGPFVPKACVPVFAMRGSSIPKPSSVSKASAQKRRRVESTASPSLGGLQSRVVQLPSSRQRSAQPSRIPEHPSGALAWKGSKRTTKELAALGSAPPAPTPQPMKLLC